MRSVGIRRPGTQPSETQEGNEETVVRTPRHDRGRDESDSRRLRHCGPVNEQQTLTKVTLQSKWVVQSQFAGYYVAKAKGYFKQVGLDVTIKAGGPDILPEQVVLGRQAESGINWFPSLLQQRDTGNDLVNIAQVYARSGTTEVTLQVERDQHVQEDARQEVRCLDLRERVRAARGTGQERHGPGQGRRNSSSRTSTWWRSSRARSTPARR